MFPGTRCAAGREHLRGVGGPFRPGHAEAAAARGGDEDAGAGDKVGQSVTNEKTLAEIAKENNFKLYKLGPFSSSGGSIEGLDQPGISEDFRTQTLVLEVGEPSEVIESSTDNDITDNEIVFIVKLNKKLPVSKEIFKKDFPAYLKQSRARASASGYNSWLQQKRNDLYKYSFNAYIDGEGEVLVDEQSSEIANKYFESKKAVTVVAKPKPGYKFKEWIGSVREGKTNAINSVVINNNSSVTATFIPAP